MAYEGQDLSAVIEPYREHFQRAQHLDRLAVTIFAIIAALLLVNTVILHTVVESGELVERFSITFLMVSLAVGGAHIMIVNAVDYQVTFVVIGQLTRGLGLVQRGLFPASLLAQVPTSFWSLVSRCLGGIRGPLLIVLMVFGWHSAFEAFSQFATGLFALGLGLLVPLILATASFEFSHRRFRRQLEALKRHQALADATRDELVDSHCNLADALLWLDPPRLSHAQKQYELALEIEPDNPRAREGLERVLNWKTLALHLPGVAEPGAKLHK
ncbi:MAG: hypothetical protein HYX81_04655 [Chloroflexi bacterium]|nr:hypothetical protein [Chloroflexota bacterium]